MSDPIKNLQFQFNSLNLLDNVKKFGAVRTKYIWAADGSKRAVADAAASNGFEYFGSFVFTKTSSGLESESAAFPEGRFMAASTVFATVFHVTDHLGSVRAEIDGSPNMLRTVNDYMPYGTRFSTDGHGELSRYQFSGKERQTVGTTGAANDMELLDFGARMYDPSITRWLTQDPLAERYYSTSPYAYCANNPIRYIDPNGMAYGDFYDENGNFIGTDGIDDNLKYLMKTRQKNFNDSNIEDVKGAGLSAKDASATKKFIKDNSGNTKAFEENSIAYDNSIGLEISSDNMTAMNAEVGRDNGAGGESRDNNREYGGTIIDGKVVLAEPGSAGDLRAGIGPSILLQGGGMTFHSHPSGSIEDPLTYAQHPSSQDISTSGSRNHLVFGRGNNRVYVYNSTGIQASVPGRTFTRIFKK